MLKKIRDIVLSPVFIGLLLLASLIVRRYSLPVISLDMQAGLFDWYGFILKRGFVGAFKENFALYTPPYLYLLWLGTLVDGIVSRVTLIKTISMLFDVLCAFYVYKITALKYPDSRVPWLAAVLAFSLPTVILNSSYWPASIICWLSGRSGRYSFLGWRLPLNYSPSSSSPSWVYIPFGRRSPGGALCSYRPYICCWRCPPSMPAARGTMS